MRYAVVNSTIGFIKSKPDKFSENADEVLFGMNVEILEALENDWYYIRTHYNYDGYIDGSSLLIDDNKAKEVGRKLKTQASVGGTARNHIDNPKDSTNPGKEEAKRKRQIAKLEEKITICEEEMEALKDESLKEENGTDYKKLEILTNQIDEKEREWEELVEALDQLQ